MHCTHHPCLEGSYFFCVYKNKAADGNGFLYAKNVSYYATQSLCLMHETDYLIICVGLNKQHTECTGSR
jgi:pectate lyase